MDLNGSWWFAFIAAARWVGFRLDLIAAAVLALTAILVMAVHNKVHLVACLLHLAWSRGPCPADITFIVFAQVGHLYKSMLPQCCRPCPSLQIGARL